MASENNPVKQYGKHKKFDPKLFEKYDIPARIKTKQILGDFVQDNPNIYEQDLIITDKDYKYKYLEIQVCAGWKDQKYPFKNIYIYEHKIRFGDETLFIFYSKDLSRGYVFDLATCRNNEPVRLKKYSKYFIYLIPWNQVLFFISDLFNPEDLKLY